MESEIFVIFWRNIFEKLVRCRKSFLIFEETELNKLQLKDVATLFTCLNLNFYNQQAVFLKALHLKKQLENTKLYFAY